MSGDWCKSSTKGTNISMIDGTVTCNDCGKLLGNFFDNTYTNRSTQGHLRTFLAPRLQSFIPTYFERARLARQIQQLHDSMPPQEWKALMSLIDEYEEVQGDA